MSVGWTCARSHNGCTLIAFLECHLLMRHDYQVPPHALATGQQEQVVFGMALLERPVSEGQVECVQAGATHSLAPFRRPTV